MDETVPTFVTLSIPFKTMESLKTGQFWPIIFFLASQFISPIFFAAKAKALEFVNKALKLDPGGWILEAIPYTLYPSWKRIITRKIISAKLYFKHFKHI